MRNNTNNTGETEPLNEERLTSQGAAVSPVSAESSAPLVAAPVSALSDGAAGVVSASASGSDC